MGSYVSTKSTAIDNRLAVTDNALGISSSGSNNNVALAGHIFNLSSSASASGLGGGNKGGAAGDIKVDILDGGAIANSFQFADNALSMVLSSVLQTEKLQSDSAQYTADAIGQALADVAAQNKAAQDSALSWIEENFKNLMGVAAIGFVGWYFIKKAK